MTKLRILHAKDQTVARPQPRVTEEGNLVGRVQRSPGISNEKLRAAMSQITDNRKMAAITRARSNWFTHATRQAVRTVARLAFTENTAMSPH